MKDLHIAAVVLLGLAFAMSLMLWSYAWVWTGIFAAVSIRLSVAAWQYRALNPGEKLGTIILIALSLLLMWEVVV
jgi:hypothetical protein